MCRLILFVIALAMAANGQTAHQILASGYSNGFYPVTFYEDTGSIEAGLMPVPGSENDSSMSWTVFDDRTRNLYAIHEGGGPDEDIVSRWIPTSDLSSISREQTATVKGTGPAHVALNTEFNIIFISNYGSGSVVVYSIDPVTGDIGAEPLYFEEYERGSGVVPDRQEASHAHGSFFFRDNAYVADLGGDIIWHYKIKYAPDGGSVIVEKGTGDYAASPGFGPRHLAVDELRNRAYVLNELEQYITVLNIDPEDGTPSLAEEIPYTVDGAMEDDAQTGAEIALTQDGTTLYASHRNYDGSGAMLVFTVQDESPFLTQIQSTSTSGSVPRFFTIVGQHVLVPDQVDSIIDVFKMDLEDQGKLNLVELNSCGLEPTCLAVIT